MRHLWHPVTQQSKTHFQIAGPARAAHTALVFCCRLWNVCLNLLLLSTGGGSHLNGFGQNLEQGWHRGGRGAAHCSHFWLHTLQCPAPPCCNEVLHIRWVWPFLRRTMILRMSRARMAVLYSDLAEGRSLLPTPRWSNMHTSTGRPCRQGQPPSTRRIGGRCGGVWGEP